MRLRTTLFALLFVIAVVLSGTIYFGFALHKTDILTQERQEVQTTANVVATDIDSQVDGHRALVELWARNGALRVHESRGQREALTDFFESTRFEGASVISANGTLVEIVSTGVSASAERQLRGLDLSDRRYVRAALNGSTFVSDPFNADSGRRIIAVSTPIRHNGSIVGVLTGSIHLSRSSLFENAVSLAQDNHRVVVTAGNQTLYAGGSVPRGETIRRTDTVSELNWTVAAVQSRSDLTARLQRATLLQAGGVVLALLSIGFVGVWITRRTITQLDALIRGLDELEAGSYSREMDLTASDEWHEISARFNALRKTLQQRESQLRVLNRVLRHNLRNDMNVVMAHAESVLANDETPEEISGDVEKIIATASRLIDTSDHARAFYEDLLSEGQRERKPVDVVAIVEARVETLRAEFPACDIEVDLAESAWALDTTAIPIVVEEVVHNAIVHNDRPESERIVEVSVETVSRDGAEMVKIGVTDNGPGIPMVEEALLTDELEETPVEHGSGLGVWLVNWLVDQLDGTVEAHSGIDRGTTVSIFVPAAEETPGDGESN